jgi:HK97 family phage portal protein
MRFFGYELSRVSKANGPTPVRSSMYGWVRESFAGAWQKGVTIDPLGTITAYAAVYACISRIANDVAKLEPRLMELQPDGTSRPAVSTSPYWEVIRKPNTFQNRIQFYCFWLSLKLMYGNSFALKKRDARGIVYAKYLLDPRRVTPMVTPEGDVYYSLGGDDIAKCPAGMVAPASEIIHDRCVTLWHPLVGVSPIYACGASATQGNRIQSNSAQFFENMSRPSGMLSAPGTIDEVTATRLKSEWEANYTGLNLGRLAVLGDGLKYEPMTIPAQEAQLIDQLKWTVEDVARAFGMPLYKIGAGPIPTNNNVEALNQQYYSDCLQTHIESIELCLNEGLGLPPVYRVEFDLDGLLRMDGGAQIEMLVKAREGGLMAPNEGRAKINLPPKKGGESIYMQQQYFSLEALAKRDTQADPFGPPATPPAPPAPPPEPKSYDAEFAELYAQLKSAAEREQSAQEAMKNTVNTALAEVAAREAALSSEIAQLRTKKDSGEELVKAMADRLIERFRQEPVCV